MLRNRMLPSSTDLEYFIEIAKTLNFSRAAERLGVTQPSLSLAIKRLETTIESPLFIRNKKGVLLTPAGKQVMNQAQSLLNSWEQIKQKAHDSSHKIQGYYKLGCHPSVALYSLSKFLPKLLSRHPELNIQLVHGLSREITEMVISFQIDIGIVINPVKHPDLMIKKLATDQVSFWTAQKNKNSDILICDPSLLQTQFLLKKIKNSGLCFSRTVHSSQLEVIAELVASGAGVGILPSRVATRHDLKKIKTAPHFNDEVCLIYRVESKSIQSIQEISNSLIQTF